LKYVMTSKHLLIISTDAESENNIQQVRT